MNDWVNRSIVNRSIVNRSTAVFSLIGSLMVCIVANPIIATGREVLPSDSGVVAYLEEVSSGFSRADGLGDVATSQWVQLAYDSPRQRLLIADYHHDRLLVINKKGQVEAILANSSSATVPAPWMKDCHDVAVDSQGNIYIADTRNATVWILCPDLSWSGALPIPPDEEVGFPWSVAVDSKDRVIVGDYRSSGNSRILVYEQGKQPGLMDLATSFKFNPPGEKAYCGVPFDVAVDSQDRIIIAEGSTTYYTAERVHVFDREFRWVTTFGSAGSGPGQFSQVTSLAVAPGDTIIVSDRYHSSTVSFFFRNGTYAGRVSGLDHPTGLIMRSGRLLVGDGGGVKTIDVNWGSLHPIEILANPEPGPEPITEAGMLALLVLVGILSVSLARRNALLT